MAYRVDRCTDPAAFLELAGAHLATEPVLSTVVSTTLERAVADPSPVDHPRWWAALVDERTDEVVGVAMRTAPFRPYPLYLLPMPTAAAEAFGAWLLAHEPDVAHANGVRASVEAVLGVLADDRGGSTRVLEHDRLWEATSVLPPTGVPGGARAATLDDLDLVTAWCLDFMPAADRQAGRPPREGEGEHLDRDYARGKIERGLMWLWEDKGEVVHLTGWNPPALGVARVGPVYTPVEHRGHGYAAALVAQVTERILSDGARACLFTDVDNPVSNGVYERIGYRPVAEMVRMEVAPQPVAVTTPGPA
jgi:GNAT superfamily N-acetyltransferase